MNKDIKQFLSYIASIFSIIILLTVWSNVREFKIGEVTITSTTSGSSYIPGTSELDKYMDKVGVKKLYMLKTEMSNDIVGLFLTKEECFEEAGKYYLPNPRLQCYSYDYGKDYYRIPNIKDYLKKKEVK